MTTKTENATIMTGVALNVRAERAVRIGGEGNCNEKRNEREK